jgi:hypothetical protein
LSTAPRSRPTSTGTSRAAKVYVELLTQIWEDVHPLIGAISLAALYASAVRNVSAQYPFLDRLQIGLEGLDGGSAYRAFEKAPDEDVERAMAKLTKRLLELFESLAGPILVSQVLPMVIRAEKSLGKGKDG